MGFEDPTATLYGKNHSFDYIGDTSPRENSENGARTQVSIGRSQEYMEKTIVLLISEIPPQEEMHKMKLECGF